MDYSPTLKYILKYHLENTVTYANLQFICIKCSYISMDYPVSRHFEKIRNLCISEISFIQVRIWNGNCTFFYIFYYPSSGGVFITAGIQVRKCVDFHIF